MEMTNIYTNKNNKGNNNTNLLKIITNNTGFLYVR